MSLVCQQQLKKTTCFKTTLSPVLKHCAAWIQKRLREHVFLSAFSVCPSRHAHMSEFPFLTQTCWQPCPGSQAVEPGKRHFHSWKTASTPEREDSVSPQLKRSAQRSKVRRILILFNCSTRLNVSMFSGLCSTRCPPEHTQMWDFLFLRAMHWQSCPRTVWETAQTLPQLKATV